MTCSFKSAGRLHTNIINIRMPRFDFTNQIFGNFKSLTCFINIVLSWSKNLYN